MARHILVDASAVVLATKNIPSQAGAEHSRQSSVVLSPIGCFHFFSSYLSVFFFHAHQHGFLV